MARKSDKDAAQGLAVGLVIACALDVKKSNEGSVEAAASLSKLLTAIEPRVKVSGWPGVERADENATIKEEEKKHCFLIAAIRLC